MTSAASFSPVSDELLVAEVGDELERAAEPGDEAVEDVLGRQRRHFLFDLRDPGDPRRPSGRDLLLGQPAALAHPGQPPAAGVAEYRGDRRVEGLLAAGGLHGALQMTGVPPP